MSVCPKCNGIGVIGGCPSCGAANYDFVSENDTGKNKKDDKVIQASIPLYYQEKKWNSVLATKPEDTEAQKLVITMLNELVEISATGRIFNKSYIILLPPNHGKRYALFSMISNFKKHGFSVAPVADVASYNLMSSRNRYEDQELLLSYLRSDVTFVYGTEFITRRLTSKLFRSLASTRALHGLPTVLFAGHSYDELSAWDDACVGLKGNYIKQDNLAAPLILDGVVRRTHEHK